MTPAKKRKNEESPDDSEQLRDAIINRIQRGDQEETEESRPPSDRPSVAAPGTAAEKESLLERRIALFGPRLRDMALFCRQFATLLDVGIPLVRSLKILSERTQHPRLKDVVKEVADEVERGNRLSTALEKHPRVFSPLFINVVRVGEVGGILERSIHRLADILESKASIRRRVIAAAAYPVAAILVALVILVGIVAFAIPRFQEIYQNLNAKLPDATQILIAISEFIRTEYMVYIPVILIVLALLYLFRRTESGKRTFDWLNLRLPMIRVVNVKIAIARTTRTLGSLIEAGIPLLEALQITAEGSENLLVSDALRRVRDRVESGGKLEDQLREESLVFPPIVVDMVAIGDEAGSLDTMLNKIAETYDEEVDATLRSLSAIIEPALIVVVGLVVIFIALALLLPYFSLATHVGSGAI